MVGGKQGAWAGERKDDVTSRFQEILKGLEYAPVVIDDCYRKFSFNHLHVPPIGESG